MTINREALATQIETAFSNTGYPGDENIGRDEVASFLGKHWKDLTLEQVRARRFDLAMFSPEGFSFYLPLFSKRFCYIHKEETPCLIVLFGSYHRLNQRTRV